LREVERERAREKEKKVWGEEELGEEEEGRDLRSKSEVKARIVLN